MASLIIIVAMFALLWVLLIRPQRARQQQQRQLLDSVAVGDEILTVGGIYGLVEEIEDDDDLVVQVAEGVNVRVSRRAVAAVVKPEDADEHDDEDGEESSDEPVDATSAPAQDESDVRDADEATMTSRQDSGTGDAGARAAAGERS